jgi:cell division protease FtsH
MAQDSQKDNDKRNRGGSGPPGPDREPPFFNLNRGQFRFSLWFLIFILFGLPLINALLFQPRDPHIEYSQFKELVRNGEIVRVEMREREYLGFSRTGEADQGEDGQVYRTFPVEDSEFVPLLEEQGVEYYAVPEQQNILFNMLLGWGVPLLFLFLIWRIMFRRMGNLGSNVMSFGQNKARIVAEGDTGTSFGDVAGADEAKAELVEVVDFLKTPEKYTAIGGKIPKGVLLVGPPGTGKTLLARAVAGEAGVPFFRMSGADFVEMFVGVGAARVRDLFRQAREKAPCIIFIDELDAIGKARFAAGASGNDEREQTLNQLLVEMDGFDATTGVIVLAATNRPEILDPALLRAGRFDRQVLVDKPDLNGREAILRIHTKNVKLDESVDLRDVARSTPGFAGADLANAVNEAALLAVRAGRKLVVQRDFEEAIEKLVAGLEKRTKLISPKERTTVAYHETGHALVAAFTEGADPVQKISIVPRGLGALGYTLQLPVEDRYLLTEQELLGKIDVLLGGRAAEQLVFGKVSTGAGNDLVKATDIARKMITEYGMSDKFRNVVLTRHAAPMLGERAEGAMSREYSENTQSYVDEEVARVINERYDHVVHMLAEREELLRRIADQLLEREVIEDDEFRALVASVT